MDYTTASQIQVGDIVLIKNKKYQATHVLGVVPNKDRTSITFKCTDGYYNNDDLAVQVSHEELERLFIEDKDTKVFIKHNNEIGQWLYSVEVVGSGGYWLDSFVTEDEAKQYVKDNNLKYA